MEGREEDGVEEEVQQKAHQCFWVTNSLKASSRRGRNYPIVPFLIS